MLVDQSTWQKLWRAAREIPATPECLLRVPSPLHLVAMKVKAASAPHRRANAQDLSDAAELLKKYHLSLSAPQVRDIVLNYGGETSLERLRKML